MEFDLYKAIENYIPRDEKEKECVEKAKDFLKNNDNCFSRTNLKGHITAGALVMDENGNVLLNHHKALDKWLLFGGHSDGESNSLNVAKREVMEESGIAELDDLGGKILDIDAHIIPENPAHFNEKTGPCRAKAAFAQQFTNCLRCAKPRVVAKPGGLW